MIIKRTDTASTLIAPPISQRFKVGSIELQAGESVGEHSTKEREEILVILQGSGQVVCGQETAEVSQGDLVYIPGNQDHNVFNHAQEPLKYIYIVTPLEP